MEALLEILVFPGPLLFRELQGKLASLALLEVPSAKLLTYLLYLLFRELHGKRALLVQKCSALL